MFVCVCVRGRKSSTRPCSPSAVCQEVVLKRKFSDARLRLQGTFYMKRDSLL